MLHLTIIQKLKTKKFINYTFFVITLFSLQTKSAALNLVLSKHGIQIDGLGFLDVNVENIRKTKEIELIQIRTNKKKSPYVEIDILKPIDKSKAEREMNYRLNAMKHLSKNNPTPYRGEVTLKSDCDRKNIPSFQRNINKNGMGMIASILVNKKYTLGDCESLTQLPYMSHHAFYFYEEKKSYIVISIFDIKKADQKTWLMALENTKFK